ncbi:MAG TPA: branched-chain amino acid ABC transporter permease [Rhodopila sp.]|uniref:branched-chain amino acid ABC transporter permease n=1 Tax=Rhodopila sp. TaxID=2480087 RepID=UPI002C276746|nr:branched-chain amino acid ABC transporter permease [Rhodopila sp.]HVY16847.1 branched-chain amino acid ABC transporter permease [Rhodopila sp.]
MRTWPPIGIAAFLIGFVVIAAWPLVVQDVFYQRIGALVLLAAISASAWNLLGGYAGQVSVGHAVYFGAGAYASLVMFTQFGWPPIAGAPIGVLVSFAIALVVGTPTFRLRGHYFSMATIAAAELIRILASNWPLVGAAVGLMGPPVPRSIWDLSFISPVPYHYLFLAVLIVLLALTWHLQRSRMGYYLAAIRGGDRAARSLGVPVLRYKVYALLLSAGFTSLAGSLYAIMVGFADPDSTLGILVSVKMLIVAALGGAGSLFGPLVGAVILIPLEETTNAMFGGSGTGITFIVYGAIILLIARFQPGGVAALWNSILHRRQARVS